MYNSPVFWWGANRDSIMFHGTSFKLNKLKYGEIKKRNLKLKDSEYRKALKKRLKDHSLLFSWSGALKTGIWRMGEEKLKQYTVEEQGLLTEIFKECHPQRERVYRIGIIVALGHAKVVSAMKLLADIVAHGSDFTEVTFAAESLLKISGGSHISLVAKRVTDNSFDIGGRCYLRHCMAPYLTDELVKNFKNDLFDKSVSTYVKRASLYSLVMSGRIESFNLIKKVLSESKNTRLRHDAIRLLALIKVKSISERNDFLITLLKSKDQYDRRDTAFTMVQLNEDGFRKPLFEALSKARSYENNALEGLAFGCSAMTSSEDEFNTIVKKIFKKSMSPYVLQYAVMGFTFSSYDSRKLLDFFHQQYKKTILGKSAEGFLLGLLLSQSEDAYKLLAQIVEERTYSLRREYAIFALAHAKSTKAIPKILKCLTDSDNNVRLASTISYVIYGEVMESHIDKLVKVKEEDKTNEARLGAAFAIDSLSLDNKEFETVKILAKLVNNGFKERAMNSVELLLKVNENYPDKHKTFVY